MAVFKVKTKNKVNVCKKPRVYFTCHQDDFEKYFDKICGDVFKTHDCAIYYTEDMTETMLEDEKEADIGRINLLVVPVTKKLLCEPNRAMFEDVPYGKKECIPILPIVMEAGLDKIYSRYDKFGEQQYLNAYYEDPTEIPYEEKLKKYLEKVLVGDELANRIREAFDSYMFLSYRKKDRKYANELMRMIHNISECRDVAVWFDEFLVPGESFKDNIEKVLDKCTVFTLLVTPRILEKVKDINGKEVDNYVVSTEIPLARKKRHERGIEFLAVEMEPTNKEALKKINVENCISSKARNFNYCVYRAVTQYTKDLNDSPEHNYLIGLAYLLGIDMEVNHDRGIELITKAAELGCFEAMNKLYEMYRDGIGINVDYNKSLRWAIEIYRYHCEVLCEVNSDMLSALNNLAEACGKAGNTRKSLELHEKSYVLHCKIYGKKDDRTLISLNNLAIAFGEEGDHNRACELYEKVYELRRQLLGEEHIDTLNSLNGLAITYAELGYNRKAVQQQEKVCFLFRRIIGEDHPLTLKSLNNLAIIYDKLEEYEKEIELLEDVYSTFCRVLGEMHPDTLTCLGNLALAYGKLGDRKKEIELLEKIYLLYCSFLGEEYDGSLVTLHNLAVTYSELGNQSKSLELRERLYNIKCRVLGEKHPEMMEMLASIGRAYGKNNNHLRSAELTEKLYYLRCRTLGEEHEDTLIALNNLAAEHYCLKHYDRAIEFGEKSYKVCCKILGEKHKSTIIALKNLAIYYKGSGNYETFLHNEKLCASQREFIGDDGSETVKT